MSHRPCLLIIVCVTIIYLELGFQEAQFLMRGFLSKRLKTPVYGCATYGFQFVSLGELLQDESSY